MVNPPPIPRIPRSWFADADIRAYLTAINQIIFQLWVQSADAPLEATVEDSSSLISSLYQGLLQGFEGAYAHAVTSNYTTVGPEIIDASNSITITLNAEPDDLEPVKINHQGAYNDLITITDGVGTDYLHVPGDSVVYCYSVDLGRWV